MEGVVTTSSSAGWCQTKVPKLGEIRLRPIISLALLAIAVLATPASAIVRGATATDPNGVRNFVLRIESQLGELCSAVLIAPDIALTAANCLRAETRYAVHGLDLNFRDVRREVVSLVLHPSFKAETPPRAQPGIDLALLRLDSPMGPGFKPMPLRALLPPVAEEDVTIAGFGTTSYNNRASARTLRYTYLRLRGEIQLGNTMLMASDSEREARTPGAGACQGDAGGPILRGDTGSYALLGIVSWSSGASEERERSTCGGLTAITPVTPNLAWINARIRQLGGSLAENARLAEEARRKEEETRLAEGARLEQERLQREHLEEQRRLAEASRRLAEAERLLEVAAYRDPPELINFWHQLDGECRGGPGIWDTTLQFCDLRSVVDDKLIVLGWCYGRRNEYGFQTRWHECEPESTDWDRFTQIKRNAENAESLALRHNNVEEFAFAAVPRPKTLAVVIGNRNYLEAPEVRFAHNDASAFARYFSDVMGLEEKKIIVENDVSSVGMARLFGRPGGPEGRLHNLARFVDEIYVFYSGHGVPEIQPGGGARGYLLPVDVPPGAPGFGAYALDDLISQLQSLPVERVTLLLDACFSGLSEGGSLVPNVSGAFGVTVASPLRQAKVSVLAATAHDKPQFAHWLPDREHGAFTFFALSGLYGDADREGDGRITLAKLQRFIDRGLAFRGFDQRPSLDSGRDDDLIMDFSQAVALPRFEQ